MVVGSVAPFFCLGNKLRLSEGHGSGTQSQSGSLSLSPSLSLSLREGWRVGRANRKMSDEVVASADGS